MSANPMKHLPMYVERALRTRSKGIDESCKANMVLQEYAIRHGLTPEQLDTWEESGLADSDITVYCEADHCECHTRQVLLDLINKEREL